MLSQSPKSQTRFGNYISESSKQKGIPGEGEEDDGKSEEVDFCGTGLWVENRKAGKTKTGRTGKSGRNVKKWAAQMRIAKIQRGEGRI